jgi:hypothetical protein
MSAKDIVLGAATGGAVATQTYVDDVFSTYLYTGNGSTQTINNGIDLAGKGGLVWVKSRNNASATAGHALFDTVRGRSYGLATQTTAAQIGPSAVGSDLISFDSNGFTVGSNNSWAINVGIDYTAWTFRKAAKFFDVQTVSHANGLMDTNINLSVLGTVGMVIAKNTSLGGDWIVWHRGLTAGNNSRLNTTAAQSTTNAWLSVSGTTATLSVNAPSGTYVIYAYAHDTAADGLIQCGSFSTNSSANSGLQQTLGWEPQFLLVKRFAHDVGDWQIIDTMRGWNTTSAGGGLANVINPNTTAAETANGSGIRLLSNGFLGYPPGLTPSSSYIYMAIRRPNKPPTSGTQVFMPIAFAYAGGIG